MPRTITIVQRPPKLTQKKRVAAYARVSSGKDAMLHSLSAQVSYYSSLIQSHEDWLYVGVYADEAKTAQRIPERTSSGWLLTVMLVKSIW